MNYSSAVMLINPNIRAIKTTYEPDTDKVKVSRVVFKTLDQTIQKGDFVVVPTDTRHKMTVVQVDEVDVEIDFEDDTEIKWVIAKFNQDDHKALLLEEQKWVDALKASEKRAKREKIKENMLAMYKDEKIENMPIALMGGNVAIEHKA